MFPFDIDDEELESTQDEEKEPKDYEISRTTGALTGRFATGLKAIEQWIYLTLSTDRYYFTQYSWDYGSELSTLIGQQGSQAYIESEVKRMLEEALLVNSLITGIEDLKCEIKGDTLTASFTALTEYGEVNINV